MKALFVHRESSLPSARVRVLQLVPHLRGLGVACEMASDPSGPWALRSLLSGSGVDVVVVQKKLPSLAAGWALRACRAPIVFDFDDAILFRDRPRAGSFESRTRRARFERMCAIADAFTCGNDYLASFCRDLGKPVLIAPSPVPLDVPRAQPGARHGALRIGWLGSPGNLGSLCALAPALRDLGARRRFVLVVICESSIALPGVEVQHVPWTLASQEREVANLDIGVMPLDDSPFSRGKCAYKLLQYMAAGLPVVASPVGMNALVVRHRQNGLLANTPDEWLNSLEGLAADPAHARRLGEAGRRTVEDGYGYPLQAERWLRFLDEVASSRPKSAASARREALDNPRSG
jgi:glycosyltransferase involved in cell wall biosynthesis